MLKKRILTLIIVVAFLLLIGCEPSPDIPTNESPIITSVPGTTATVGEVYTYNVEATDPDGDTLTYSLEVKPVGMTINPATGLINWTPAVPGTFNVVVKVSDGDLDITQSFKITVIEEEEPSPIPIPTKYYTITATAGANGAINPSGAVTVEKGSDKTFTITPDTDHHIADILVDGGSVGVVSTYTFADVKQNHTIHATFAIDTYTITATSGSGGSISPTGTVTVDKYANKLFVITPHSPFYRLLDVLVDSVSVGDISSYTFANVTADHTIHADFIFIDPVYNQDKDEHYSTIQTAINDADAGNTILVMEGTYAEGDINIDKPLTIQGAGSSSTTTIDAVGKDAGFFIDADDVTIKDLVVKNAIYRNIAFYTTTVYNPRIENVALLDSGASGLAVHQSTVFNLIIDDCLFSGNALHGMRVDSGGVINSMHIWNSHFDGNDAGMTIYGDTNAVYISNSTFNNNVAETGNPWTGGYGVYIGNANGSTKTNSDWTFNGCEFKDNHYDHPNYPATDTFSCGISLSPYWASSIVTDMLILDSEFSGNQEMGFRVYSVGVTDVSAITIEDCDFIGMIRGISLTGAGATGLQIHYCNIEGNTDYGVYNPVTTIINATDNWWGDASGAYHGMSNPFGSGDEVSNYVIYIPWSMSSN